MKGKNYLWVTGWMILLTIVELFVYSQASWGSWRTGWLLTLMATKALLVALIYMNLKAEGWAFKAAFFIPIPVAIYFLLFMMYDAAYLWHS